MAEFKDFFQKHGFVLFALFCIFFAWFNAPSAIQTISIPLIFAYIFLLLKQKKTVARTFLLVLLVSLLIFSNFIFLEFHDVPLVIQAGTTVLLEGKNPYSASFAGTSMDEVAKYNTSFWKAQGQESFLPFDNFGYLPAIFIVSVPFALFFPNAPFWIIAMVLLIFVLIAELFFIKGKENPDFLLILTFFSPFIFASVYLAHAVDFLILLLMLFFVFFFSKKRFILAGLFFGILLATKLYILLIVPFFLYVFLKEKRFELVASSALSLAVLVLPFILWNPAAFFKSNVLFLLGTGSNSLAIWNERVGILPLLKSFGIISDSLNWISIPLMVLSFALVFWFFLKKKPSFENALVYSAIASVVVFFFSKMLNPNYLTLPFFLFLGFLLFHSLNSGKSSKFYKDKKPVLLKKS